MEEYMCELLPLDNPGTWTPWVYFKSRREIDGSKVMGITSDIKVIWTYIQMLKYCVILVIGMWYYQLPPYHS